MPESGMSQHFRYMAGESVTCCGLTLYPVTVRQMTEYEACKSALLIRQATLPASYMVLPYLQAVFALDADTESGFALFGGLVRALCMATRQPDSNFWIYRDKNNPKRLSKMFFSQDGGATVIEFTPSVFAQVRKTVVEMNGDELPDESENPELVEAENDLARMQKSGLKFDRETMIESVACSMGLRARDVLDWTLYEFRKALEAKSRMLRYVICGIGEQSGFVKWKHGNPCPSWYLSKPAEMQALQPMSEVARRLGFSPESAGMPGA